jgi:hypothetical protein
MADEAKRGGQKKGSTAGAQSRQHQGVHPGSTNQKKGQRERMRVRQGSQTDRPASGKLIPDVDDRK